jgi:type II secretory pathway pseudopilin PulG
MRIGNALPRPTASDVRHCATGELPTPAFAPRGFTYIGLLIMLVIIGVTLASAGVVWHTAVQRDKERELLFAGDQFRQAIGRYYIATDGPAKQYPLTLDDLLRDPRQPSTVRHLRKLYVDPITGSAEWGLLKGRDDRIVGVFSLSEQRPLKQGNFRGADQIFAEKEKYSDWQFIYQPKLTRVTPAKQPDTPTLPTSSGLTK